MELEPSAGAVWLTRLCYAGAAGVGIVVFNKVQRSFMDTVLMLMNANFAKGMTEKEVELLLKGVEGLSS